MPDESNILEAIRGYDWESAFSCASGKPQGGCGWANTPDWAGPPEEIPNHAAPSFNREDVRKVIAVSDGEHDGDEWIVFGQLKNGHYFFVAAGCDYTGWDCQSSGRAYVGSKKYVEQFAMTIDERIRLGLTKRKAS